MRNNTKTKSLQKGDSAMSNSMAMNVRMYIVNKETTLWDRLKKYYIGNQKLIVMGLAMMNNSYSTACRMQID